MGNKKEIRILTEDEIDELLPRCHGIREKRGKPLPAAFFVEQYMYLITIKKNFITNLYIVVFTYIDYEIKMPQQKMRI